MAHKLTRSLPLLTLLGVALIYYWSSPPSDNVSVRLLQDGQLLDLDLSDTQMHDILKKTESLQHITDLTSSSRRPQLQNETRNGLEDFVVINNKVYARGDPLPKKKLKIPVLKPTTGRSLRRMDFARFKGEERKFMEGRRKEFLDRASRLSSMCKARSKLIASKPVTLIWDLKHQPGVVWCPSHQTTTSSTLLKSLRPPRANEDQARTSEADLPLPDRRRQNDSVFSTPTLLQTTKTT
ncbi:uncharacterized protein LOC119592920 [Penaeus monodon]|uniref:uncharacterized protein LOC119592920 n=1 Tax=Penaeus monodon TaxID=6687 RepID=UPI0018A73FC5|nr:uncharacterized protein LOC119592920 [Penaeus monodon]